MNPFLRNLQVWLNQCGASPRLVEDGLPGPATRRAIIETFRNRKAKRITPGDLNAFAARLKCTSTQLAAVAEVESGGDGWDSSGLLKCLWERHWMWNRVRIAVPFLSNPKLGGYTIDEDRDGINDSWEKLADAAMRWGFDVAAECASFGKFQIMGAHWRALGYPSVGTFIATLSRSEADHYEALCRFIEVNGLAPALRQISQHPGTCLAFARGYNGKGQRGYDARLAAAFRRLSA